MALRQYREKGDETIKDGIENNRARKLTRSLPKRGIRRKAEKCVGVRQASRRSSASVKGNGRKGSTHDVGIVDWESGRDHSRSRGEER